MFDRCNFRTLPLNQSIQHSSLAQHDFGKGLLMFGVISFDSVLLPFLNGQCEIDLAFSRMFGIRFPILKMFLACAWGLVSKIHNDPVANRGSPPVAPCLESFSESAGFHAHPDTGRRVQRDPLRRLVWASPGGCRGRREGEALRRPRGLGKSCIRGQVSGSELKPELGSAG